MSALIVNLYGSKTNVSLYPHSVVFTAQGTPSILNIEGVASNICEGEADLVTGNVSCDMSLFDTGISLRDKHLKEYIKADTHPKANLSYSVSKPGHFSGILRFAGSEKQVTGTISPHRDSDSSAKLAPLILKFQIDIRDFDIAEPNFKGVGILPLIDVTATVNRVRLSKSDRGRIRLVQNVSPEPSRWRFVNWLR